MRVTVQTLVFLFFLSCSPQKGQDGVNIKTEGLNNAVTFVSLNGTDLGEFVISEQAHYLSFELSNSTSKLIKDIAVEIIGSSDFAYRQDKKGNSSFPGYTGTCQKELPPNSTCKIELQFTPLKSKLYEQEITLKYLDTFGQKSIPLILKALAGNPASLFFVNEISFYDYGVFERTQKVTRYQELEIKNGGDLTAKEIVTTLSTSNSQNAFEIIENDCPQELEKNQSCHIKLSYTPLNWEVSNPQTKVQYDATLALNYIRDPKGKSSFLNGNFTFLSSNIEAEFNTLTPNLVFEELISGNQDTISFQIKNEGYRDGQLKHLYFKKSDDSLWAICDELHSDGQNYQCKDPYDQHLLELHEFPFKLKEMNACLLTDIDGRSPNSAGSSCFFELTFWPSTTFETTRDFKNTMIGLHYDSKWRDQENLITKDTFNISEATSKGPGKLDVVSFKYYTNNDNSIEYSPIHQEEAFSLFDLDRQAMILSNKYARKVQIQFKNIGESDIYLSSLKDGKNNSLNIALSTIDVIYDQIFHADCTYLPPGGTCNIIFKFTPLDGPEEVINQRMYDVNNGVNDRYKQFIFSYKNGSTFNDDGSEYQDRSYENRFTATLVRKAYVVIMDNINWLNNTYRIGDPEQDRQMQIIYYNAGTGSTPYMTTHKIPMSSSYRDLGYISNGYAYHKELEIISTTDFPSGVSKDCKNLISIDGSAPPALPESNPDLVLASGEKCVLTISSTLPSTRRYQNTVDSTLNVDFTLAWNNTLNQWRYPLSTQESNYGLGKMGMLEIGYYDGDFSKPSPELPLFGDYKTTGDVDCQVNFRSPAMIIPNISNPRTSVVMYRPKIIYPELIHNNLTYPAQIFSERFFVPENAQVPTYFSTQSIPHVSAIVDDSAEYTVHIGSYPKNRSLNFGLYFLNLSSDSKYSKLHTLELDDLAHFNFHSGHTFNSDGFLLIPNQPNTLGYGITLSYDSGNLSGIHDSRLTYAYFNGVEEVSKTIRLVAETLDDNEIPLINFTHVPYSVIFNPITETVSETLNPGASHLVGSKFYEMSESQPTPIYYDGVKGSVLYSKSQILISNDVTANEDLRITHAYMSIGSFVKIDKNYCAGKTLAPGESCLIEIKFQPTVGTPNSGSDSLLVNYAIQDDQYIKKQINFSFTAQSPAKLTLVGLSKKQVFVPQENRNYSSYEVPFGTYFHPGHIILTDFPTTRYFKQNLLIDNTTNVKASFLAALGTNPVPEGNPVLIKSKGNFKVYATRSCLYGDDEHDAVIPLEEKGFNNVTVNKCYITYEYLADATYQGTSNGIIPSESLVHLEFYDYKRLSKYMLDIHSTGFIEPNRSIPETSSLQDLAADSIGFVELSVPQLVEHNTQWGPIIGYRVFYSEYSTSFNNPFESTANYLDVLPNDDIITINAVAGKYLYVKVMALREFAGKQYLSESQIPSTKILVPPAGTIFSSELKALIDISLQGGLEFKNDAIDQCRSQHYKVIDSGVTKTIIKKLIELNIWNYIISDPSYSDYNLDTIPQWVGVGQYSLPTVFDSYDYSTTTTLFYHAPDQIGYQKPCDDTSCENLSMLKGGDGFDIPVGATFFVDPTIMKGAARCYAPLP